MNPNPEAVDLFIVTNTMKEFLEAVTVIIKDNPSMKERNMFPLCNWNSINSPTIVQSNPNAPIILWGEWHENQITTDKQFMLLMNRAMLKG